MAIVTGGSGSFGFIIATAQAEAGATVILASRNVDGCRAKAGDLRGLGVSAVGMALNLRLRTWNESTYSHIFSSVLTSILLAEVEKWTLLNFKSGL